ncbi:DISARM system helicase DrmA [Parafrankia elaeagni]|uniref:DISARM system helicase DrmA n=1 Tax=Parafrankia elaeagni TaxID=222534 RepID=UPI00036A2062|nr:DISARM system helicase DrmA [Parafrankia elaeagni]
MVTQDRQDALFPAEKGASPTLAGSGGASAGGAGTADALSPTEILDRPGEFVPATSYEVRDAFAELVRRDLLGPWDGEHEVFHPRAMGPRERYLVGMLGPKPAPRGAREAAAAESVADTETAVQGDADSDLPEVLTPQARGRIWASSMGLSFAVPASVPGASGAASAASADGAAVDVVAVTASWGRYVRQETEDDEGRTLTVWAREPVVHANREIRLDGSLGADAFRVPLVGDAETGVFLAVVLRERPGRRIVELTLVNGQPEPPSRADTAWLFQATLTVTALDGERAVFLPIDDPEDGGAADHSDHEELHLRLLYRGERRYASGRNIAVHPSVRPGERRAHRLETTWLPSYDVPSTIAPAGAGTPLAGVELSMDALAAADAAQLHRGLTPLADGYHAWLDERENEQLPGLPPRLRPTARIAIGEARGAAARIRAGITLLTDPARPHHAQALAAFRFANQAMAAQRRHTAIARFRDEHGLTYAEAKARVEAQGAAAASWRPFQLGFVLLNLPALTDPAHPERAADADALVDLLFFPTGGGKTEAYLGLTAYTFAIRRLQGTVGTGADARSGEAGVAVLMRYTLRLLTAQQFQRAAALVCATEVLRRADEATWGAERFRIGLWVGSGVSPNNFKDAADQISQAREVGDGKRANVLQTLSCPWCGTVLAAHRDAHPDENLRRVLLYCPNGEGSDACPFSQRLAPGEGLPVLTVDEEIYRYAPSLVIATVDKLAQLPWRGEAGILFGRVRQRCPRHGYRHDDLDARTGCGSSHQRRGDLPKVTSEPVRRLRPPDLIIQDELHLISGALGTTVGLFEAAVDELCSWPLPSGAGDGIAGDTGAPALAGPKIVASTATTKRARDQVLGVFGRRLAVFPPQVVDVTDTFFSRQVPVSPQNPGRRYLGICAHGTRMKSAQIRLAEILLLAGQTLFDRHGEAAEPYQTLVGYFNATRELAGMRRYLDDDVTTRVRTHGTRKGLSNRLGPSAAMLTISELTSRVSSADISDVLKRLEIAFDAELDTSVRRHAIADTWRETLSIRDSRTRERPPAHPVAEQWRAREARRPVDVVLATSMLQVGVDVSRFGLMAVVGQPKNTAEYIQASSRVGRDAARPGLVVTLYNWARPRDLAHYEDFEPYHASFYRQVEALSVTPFTRRSLDRTATGAFVAALRHLDDANTRNIDAHDVDLTGPVATRLIGRLLARAEAVAGPRGAEYLGERLRELVDRWQLMRTGPARLGYTERGGGAGAGQQRLTGLLEPAGHGRWEVLTVAQSMRETEHEISLLVPAGEELYNHNLVDPPWSFGTPASPAAAPAAPAAAGGPAAAAGGPDLDDEDAPVGDELGETRLAGPARPRQRRGA